MVTVSSQRGRVQVNPITSGLGPGVRVRGSLTDDSVHLFVTPTVLSLFIHL